MGPGICRLGASFHFSSMSAEAQIATLKDRLTSVISHPHYESSYTPLPFFCLYVNSLDFKGAVSFTL